MDGARFRKVAPYLGVTTSLSERMFAENQLLPAIVSLCGTNGLYHATEGPIKPICGVRRGLRQVDAVAVVRRWSQPGVPIVAAS